MTDRQWRQQLQEERAARNKAMRERQAQKNQKIKTQIPVTVRFCGEVCNPNCDCFKRSRDGYKCILTGKPDNLARHENYNMNGGAHGMLRNPACFQQFGE